MNLLAKLWRYQPKDRSEGTRISWWEGHPCFECFHEESDTTMHFNISEIPQLIEVLQELYDKAIQVQQMEPRCSEK